jgi:hypothetical protein
MWQSRTGSAAGRLTSDFPTCHAPDFSIGSGGRDLHNRVEKMVLILFGFMQINE